MGLQRTTEPAALPVSLEEAKAHCKVEHDAEDDLITALIGAAAGYVESYTGRSLAVQGWTLTLEQFSDEIALPRGPVSAVSSFTYLDADGEAQTVPPASYHEDLASDPARLVRASYASWPNAPERPGAVTIVYVTGSASVSRDLKQALLLLVGAWHLNREGLEASGREREVPHAVTALLANHRAFT